MRTFLLVVLGGAAGTAARYLVALALGGTWRYPVATLAVNVAGSFAIALIVPWAMRNAVPPAILAAITTGFLGGFTTYSAFNYDLVVMATAGHGAKAAGYAFVTFSACFLAGLAGLQIGR